MVLALFIGAAIVLLGLIYLIQQFWQDYAQFTHEDEAFEERIAALNDDQSNRISDEQLARPHDPEDAWTIMVHRGKYLGRRRRRPRRSRSRLRS